MGIQFTFLRESALGPQWLVGKGTGRRVSFHPAEAGSNSRRRGWAPAYPLLTQYASGNQFALWREFALGPQDRSGWRVRVLDAVFLFHPAEAGSIRLRRDWSPAYPLLTQYASGINLHFCANLIWDHSGWSVWVLDVVILFHPAEAGSNRLRREWVPAFPSLT